MSVLWRVVVALVSGLVIARAFNLIAHLLIAAATPVLAATLVGASVGMALGWALGFRAPAFGMAQ